MSLGSSGSLPGARESVGANHTDCDPWVTIARAIGSFQNKRIPLKIPTLKARDNGEGLKFNS